MPNPIERLFELEQREKEHQIFRRQHSDCDKMGVENQNLRAELKRYQELHADKVLDCVELEKQIEHFETLLMERNERL